MAERKITSMTRRWIFSLAMAKTCLASMETTVGDYCDNVREKAVMVYPRGLSPTDA